MMTIYKYTLDPGKNTLEVPLFSEALHVAEQHGNLCIWFLVLDTQAKADRHIDVYETGHEVPHFQSTRNHIGSVAMTSGLVWHVFERRVP